MHRALILAVTLVACGRSDAGPDTVFSHRLILIDHTDPMAVFEPGHLPRRGVLDLGDGRLLAQLPVTYEHVGGRVVVDLRNGRIHSWSQGITPLAAGAITNDEGILLVYQSPGWATLIRHDGSSEIVAFGSELSASYDGFHFHLWGRELSPKVCPDALDRFDIEIHEDAHPKDVPQPRIHRPDAALTSSSTAPRSEVRIPITLAHHGYRKVRATVSKESAAWSHIESPDGETLRLRGQVLLSFGDDGRIWAWAITDGSYQRFWSKAHLRASENLPWLRRAPESTR